MPCVSFRIEGWTPPFFKWNLFSFPPLPVVPFFSLRDMVTTVFSPLLRRGYPTPLFSLEGLCSLERSAFSRKGYTSFSLSTPFELSAVDHRVFFLPGRGRTATLDCSRGKQPLWGADLFLLTAWRMSSPFTESVPPVLFLFLLRLPQPFFSCNECTRISPLFTAFHEETRPCWSFLSARIRRPALSPRLTLRDEVAFLLTVVVVFFFVFFLPFLLVSNRCLPFPFDSGEV